MPFPIKCDFEIEIGVYSLKIHGNTPEIPRTKWVGTRWQRRNPHHSGSHHPTHEREGPPRRVETPKLAVPPAKMGSERRTKWVHQPAPKMGIPESSRTPTMAAIPPRRFQTGDEHAAVSPKSMAWGLEIPRAAQERPSCGNHGSTPAVLS